MKILLVTFQFAPYNIVGSVRVGKMAKALRDFGHDVRVLTAAPLEYPETMPLEIPAERVMQTPWWSVNKPLLWLARRMGRASGSETYTPATSGTGRVRSLSLLARAFTNFPDGQMGWYHAALRAGRSIMRGWQPDLVLSSAPPFTGHMIARRLAQEGKVPWVADFRDLFSENPYTIRPTWRLNFDRWLERRVMRGAAGCVTISEPLAASLRVHDRPVEIILNGFDPADLPKTRPTPSSTAPVTILYTGTIYPGRRDPSPLFAAVATLGPLRERIELAFCGQDLRGVQAAAQKHGVHDRLKLIPTMPYRAALQAQAEADVLLLLLWNSPEEVGVLPAKLFEYVGAGRPVLALGLESGAAADIIRSRNLGVVANDTAMIAAQLRRWIEEKTVTQGIAGPPPEAKNGLSRIDQFRKLDAFLRRCAPEAS